MTDELHCCSYTLYKSHVMDPLKKRSGAAVLLLWGGATALGRVNTLYGASTVPALKKEDRTIRQEMME